MKNFLIVAILIAAAGGTYWAMNKNSDAAVETTQQQRGPQRAVPITTAAVTTLSFANRIEAIGTTFANESVIITAKVTDKISQIHFTDGARVEKNELLVELTNDEQAAELAEAKADRDDARVQLKRLEDLVQQNTVSVSQVDETRARYSIANAKLDGIVARLKDRVIRAPFAGVLGFRQVSPGTLVTPGTVITTLDDISELKLDFSVPELFLGAITVGGTVTAKSPAFRNDLFRGTISGIGSRIDEVTRTVTIRARLPNVSGSLRPGMLMTVELQTSTRTALSVPEAAVVPTDRDAYVYVIGADNIALRRSVSTGQRYNGMIEIISGLDEDEVVAVLGIVSLRNGVPVTITNPAGA